MSIYTKKGSPYLWYDFQFKGVRYSSSTGVTDRAEAKAIEAAERTKAARAHAYGVPDQRDTMTVTQATGRYYIEIGQHTVTADAELSRLDVIAKMLGPNLPWQDITDDKIAIMVAKLRGRKWRGKLVTNATVNRYTEALRRVWRRAAKVWKITHGDEPGWGSHLLDEPSERVRDLKPEEEARLFANLREDYHPLVRFALLSGMRLGNCRTLKWSEVDYHAGVVTVHMKSKKPGGRPHTVPLTGAMITLLANERSNHPVYVFTYLCQRSRTTGGRVLRRRGERYPFTRNGWRHDWNDALKAADIEDFHFHDLRHTAATRTLRAGGNLKVVQKMLGHTDITTTARYAHALTEDVREAMEAAHNPHNSPRDNQGFEQIPKLNHGLATKK
jgi:integrase